MTISEKVLNSIKVGSDLLTEIDGVKYLPYKLMWGSQLQGYNRNSVQAVVSWLSKRGLLAKIRYQNEIFLSVTEEGESFLSKKKKQTTFDLKVGEGKWDGLYRVIIFDIPEVNRSVRDVLRASLKKVGSVCWQKSVWVTKANITRSLNDFIAQNNLESSCSVLEVKEIYNNKIKQKLN